MRRDRVTRDGPALAAALMLSLSLAPALAQALPAAPLVVNSLEDLAVPCAPQLCTLRGALAVVADGGTIAFDPAILPGTITLQLGALQVPAKSIGIVGPGAGLLAIDAAQNDRILTLQGGALAMSGVTLINGRTVVVAGSDGAGGSGAAGGPGSLAEGGCINVSGWLSLRDVVLRHCTAQGGNGGAGGSGLTSADKAGGKGGAGGSGGTASGGAIFVNFYSTLVLSQTSIVDAHAIGGSGGKGGDGGSGVFTGSGGRGGAGGRGAGGAIYAFTPTSVQARNVTIGQSAAQGGKGGNGGSADPDYSLSAGGNGGDGGSASGGLVVSAFGPNPPSYPDTVAFAFSTFGEGTVTSGLHGSGGRGKTRGGAGADGTATAAALAVSASTPALSLDKSAVFGAPGVDLCAGPISSFYYPNMASDLSCGNAYYAPAVASAYLTLDLASPVPAYVPRFQGVAINGAPCSTIPSAAFQDPVVATDMRSTARPQGAACDIGAIEADYVFVGEFD